MASAVRTLLVVPALALVILVCVNGAAQTAASNATTNARGQTLFGMNVPSLAALDEAESAIGARPAIVGTFADWAHESDFPRELADAINRAALSRSSPGSPGTPGAAAPTSRSTRSPGSLPATMTR